MSKLYDLYARKAKINLEIKALKAKIAKLEQEKTSLYPLIEHAERRKVSIRKEPGAKTTGRAS